jgi:hypothetical protein
MASITFEQLIDIVQQDLTFSGSLPKVLPDQEVKRMIREICLEWFYKNYQFAVQKFYYFIKYDKLTRETYTAFQYFQLPEEVENITKIVKLEDTSLFRLGIQAPNLSINLGVTNQPFLTSFVTTAGDLALYRSTISYFADEINKLTKNTIAHNYNHINKRLHFLSSIPDQSNLMLECWVRIQEEELFDFEMFKRFVIGTCRSRMGELIGRFNFNMPGNFTYNANDIISQGKEMVEEVKTYIKEQSTTSWFKMSR